MTTYKEAFKYYFIRIFLSMTKIGIPLGALVLLIDTMDKNFLHALSAGCVIGLGYGLSRHELSRCEYNISFGIFSTLMFMSFSVFSGLSFILLFIHPFQWVNIALAFVPIAVVSLIFGGSIARVAILSKKASTDDNKTSNNVIVPMDSDRIQRISNMSVEDARKTYDNLLKNSGSHENDKV